MNKLFKGQISCKAVFSKCAQARYYYGILAATEMMSDIFFSFFAAQSKIRQKDLDANYVMQKKLVVKGPYARNDVQIFPFQ